MSLLGVVSMPVSFKALRHDASKAQMLNDSNLGQRLMLGPTSRGSCFGFGFGVWKRKPGSAGRPRRDGGRPLRRAISGAKLLTNGLDNVTLTER